MAHTETMLESKEIFNGRVIRVTVDKVQLEDGTTSTREIVHHHGGACILPVDADGSVTMVRQFRYAFGEEIWELPAGKLEADEDPFEAAKRELSEECGLTADNFYRPRRRLCHRRLRQRENLSVGRHRPAQHSAAPRRGRVP